MTCLKCGGTGKVVDPITGIEVACDCQIDVKQESKNKALEYLIKQKEKVESGTAECETGEFTKGNRVTVGESKSAYAVGAIPEHRKDDNFSVEYLKESIRERYKTDKRPVNGINNYINTLSGIYLDIQEDKKVDNSYFISAHNGYGKTTFANTCIKLLHSKGKLVVPYIPLIEIYNIINAENLLFRVAKANIKNEREQEGYTYSTTSDKIVMYDKHNECGVLANYNLENFVKRYSTFNYSYKDFLECELLFTCFSEIFLHKTEMMTLTYILKERSRIGKATVVFGDKSLSNYKENGDARLYWDDLVANTQYEKRSLDRLVYVACYRGGRQ